MGWEILLPHPADLLYGWIIRRLRKSRAQKLEMEAKSWPRASGAVYACGVKRAENPLDIWHSWQVQVIFNYTVNGEYYSGTSLLPPETEDEAAELAERWKQRSRIVRYWPDDPSKSVLLMEDQKPAAASRKK